MQITRDAREAGLRAVQRGAHPGYSQEWQRWRSLQDRIINHPEYRYGSKHVQLMLKLAQFNSSMMGKFNTLAWQHK